MSDSLRPSEIIFTATAKPPSKEKSNPPIGIALSLDAVADGLQTSDTIDVTKIEDIINRINKTNDPAVKDNLVLLKNEMDALEVTEVAEALATIDSPWGDVAQQIAQSDRLKQSVPDKKLREHYIDKLLFPLGAELYRGIRTMTTDPLTRQLMFHSIADDIRSNPNTIHAAQASIPLPTHTGIVKNPMRRISIGLLGTRLDGHESEAQINALYKKSIHTAVLRSRLSAEQPMFDLTTMEQSVKTATQEVLETTMPFVKEEAAQTLRETQAEHHEMKRIRQIIDKALPSVHDETSLMSALDKVQRARFEGTKEEIAPYKLESWVPEHVQKQARHELESLSIPKEDLYAKILKKFDAAERQFRSGQITWADKKYKDHMKWLADPVAQANRNQRIINIVDLIMTLTTLVYGTTGGIQRQIEGVHPNGMSIADYIDYIESQHPWEAAADLATPKKPKRINANIIS